MLEKAPLLTDRDWSQTDQTSGYHSTIYAEIQLG